MPSKDPYTRNALEDDKFREITLLFTTCRQLVDTHEKISLETKEKFRNISTEAQELILGKIIEASKSGFDIRYRRRGVLDDDMEIWITRIKGKLLELDKLIKTPRNNQYYIQQIDEISIYVVNELLGTIEFGLGKFKKA